MQQVRAASKKELKRRTARYLHEMMRHGTTTVEIKTGYGLDMNSEIKMLEGIAELRDEEMIGVVPTFLARPCLPAGVRRRPCRLRPPDPPPDDPVRGQKRLAAFCDVFCEQGYFGTGETTAILDEGKRWGMRPKMHAEELQYLGGAQVRVRSGPSRRTTSNM